jgi:hypothetical protein
MSNTILTPTAVTREVLRVAHEKLSFIGTIDRQYDDSYAKTGAKIGDTLKIRLPNKYEVRTGKTLQVQDTTEQSVALTVATQKGVDMNFSTAELTMDLDDFSNRIIQPAVAALMSDIESTMLDAVTKEVYNSVGAGGTAPIILTIAQAKAKLNQNLAPKDDQRCFQMESVDMAASVDELKGLFHDSSEVSKQYREGKVGKAVGLTWYENERVYRHANDADVSGLAVNNGTLAEGMTTLTVDGASSAPTAGSVFTVSATYAVHPETKVAYTHLQQFTVVSATTTVITFQPAMYAAGALKNVSILPVNDDDLVFVSAATTAFPQNLAYHKEAFAFATADLELPEGVAFAAREMLDGLSCRLVRQYDINNDMIPCRLDILHGYKAIRPEWAVRLPGKGS